MNAPLCSAISENIPIDVLRKVHYIKKHGSSAAFSPIFKNYPALFDFILMKIPPAASRQTAMPSCAEITGAEARPRFCQTKKALKTKNPPQKETDFKNRLHERDYFFDSESSARNAAMMA